MDISGPFLFLFLNVETQGNIYFARTYRMFIFPLSKEQPETSPPKNLYDFKAFAVKIAPLA